MNLIERMVETLCKIEEESGRLAPYIELTTDEYVELKQAIGATRVLTEPCEVPMPDSFMGLTIRVKK